MTRATKRFGPERFVSSDPVLGLTPFWARIERDDRAGSDRIDRPGRNRPSRMPTALWASTGPALLGADQGRNLNVRGCSTGGTRGPLLAAPVSINLAKKHCQEKK